MNEDNTTFGKFIVVKRKGLDITARELAAALDISYAYMCEIEKDKKSAVSKELLDTLANVLHLTEDETELMYDLAAFSQKTISADLPEYIMEHKVVRTALRTAKKNDIADEKWDDFISRIENSKNK